MTSIEITERAEADILSLVDFLSEASTVRAEAFIDEFERVLARLRRFPESGTPRSLSDAGNERVAMAYPSRVIYRFEGGVVRILRVIHIRASLDALPLG